MAFALVLGAAPVVAKLASGALGKAIFMVGLGCLNRLAGALLGVVLGVLAWAYVLATIGQIGFRGAKAVAEGPTLVYCSSNSFTMFTKGILYSYIADTTLAEKEVGA